MKSPVPIIGTFLGFLAVMLLMAKESEKPPTKSSESPIATTLFIGVKVYDGKSDKLTGPANVLIQGDRIVKVSTDPIPVDRSTGTTIINGNGRTLMPGLIDAHVHLMMESLTIQRGLTSDIGYANLVAAGAAEMQLMRGFTSVRDLGGASFSLKAAIDEGIYPGPRIFPSGATISQTGGHGDFRFPNEVPSERSAPLTYMERTGMTIIADGADDVLKRSREQLMKGATQLKLMAGGGVSSNYDPLDVVQYTEAEIHAAVSAAENWGTYVTVHAYTPRAVQMAVEAGVKCIEHGQMIDEKTAQLMAERKVWWSLQPFMDDPESPSTFPEGSPNRIKQLQMYQGTDTAYQLAKKHNIKTAFGTDILFSPQNADSQGRMLTRLTKWYSNAEILRMATSGNAELLGLCGLRNPYPGKLGVIEAGAYADLLLIDGDPLADLNLLADPEKNMHVIMKNGKIYKHFEP